MSYQAASSNEAHCLQANLSEPNKCIKVRAHCALDWQIASRFASALCMALGNHMATQLNLPSYAELGAMRLHSLIPDDERLVEHGGFSWMGGQWLYEGIGFTWFGRLENEPHATQGAEISFGEITSDVAKRILQALGLPLAPNITLAQVKEVLGDHQTKEIFVSDRATYNYRVGGSEAYQVGCTIHETSGLTHVSLIRNDIRRRLAVA